MKLVHVYKDYFPPVVGGIERHVALMCQFQAGEADVEALVCSRSLVGLRRDVDGVPVREVGEWGRFQGAPVSPGFPFRLRRARADVTVVHTPNPTGELSALVARPNALVVRYHSDVIRQSGAMRVYRPMFERYLDSARALVAASAQYVDTSPFLNARRDRCHVIPLGIVPERYDTVSPDAIEELRGRYGGAFVFTCGRHVYYKGLAHLVAAAPAIEAAVVIGGAGPLTEPLERQARKLKAKVLFTGVLPEEALIEHLHACSVFAFPSCERSESFGLAMLEAQACAKPVVATRIGTGVEHVNLDGQTGLNVPPHDPEALAAAINRLLRNKTMAAELGEAARERVRREFDARAVARDELSLYRSLC